MLDTALSLSAYISACIHVLLALRHFLLTFSTCILVYCYMIYMFIVPYPYVC